MLSLKIPPQAKHREHCKRRFFFLSHFNWMNFFLPSSPSSLPNLKWEIVRCSHSPEIESFRKQIERINKIRQTREIVFITVAKHLFFFCFSPRRTLIKVFCSAREQMRNIRAWNKNSRCENILILSGDTTDSRRKVIGSSGLFSGSSFFSPLCYQLGSIGTWVGCESKTSTLFR